MITIMPPEAGRPVDELVGADLVLLALGVVTCPRWRPVRRPSSATRTPR